MSDDTDDGLRCSGLRDGEICIHGFRTGIGCWPTSYELAQRCEPPMCCDEERCGSLFESLGGKPIQLTWMPLPDPPIG